MNVLLENDFVSTVFTKENVYMYLQMFLRFSNTEWRLIYLANIFQRRRSRLGLVGHIRIIFPADDKGRAVRIISILSPGAFVHFVFCFMSWIFLYFVFCMLDRHCVFKVQLGL